ncbi:MAG: DJ-1/PfpI family protein [Anaerolineales bacterium]
MKRQILWILLLAAIITAILLVGCSDKPTESLSEPKVLVFVRDGSNNTEYMLTHEVGVMLSMLEEAGILAVVATQSEDSYQGSEPPLKSDILLQDVTVADYDGFLLPCMAAGSPGSIEDDAIALVAEAVAQGKPVAAQYGSVFTLAQAGLLDGKRYAYEYDAFPEGIHDSTGVVQDGNIITSGTCSYKARSTGRPDGTPELTQKLIEAVAL